MGRAPNTGSRCLRSEAQSRTLGWAAISGPTAAQTSARRNLGRHRRGDTRKKSSRTRITLPGPRLSSMTGALMPTSARAPGRPRTPPTIRSPEYAPRPRGLGGRRRSGARWPLEPADRQRRRRPKKRARGLGCKPPWRSASTCTHALNPRGSPDLPRPARINLPRRLVRRSLLFRLWMLLGRLPPRGPPYSRNRRSLRELQQRTPRS